MGMQCAARRRHWWQLTDEYLNCVLSSVLDDEGLATYQKDETKHLMEVRAALQPGSG